MFLLFVLFLFLFIFSLPFIFSLSYLLCCREALRRVHFGELLSHW